MCVLLSSTGNTLCFDFPVHGSLWVLLSPAGITAAYSLVFSRDREVPGLDTAVPLETTAAYDMKDVILGVCGVQHCVF